MTTLVELSREAEKPVKLAFAQKAANDVMVRKKMHEPKVRATHPMLPCAASFSYLPGS